jgi:two-component system NtrC family sensor kinase
VEHAIRAMVVEDSETQAFKMRLLLEEEGCEVSTVSTAENAMAELSQFHPDLILVDYYLPGMLGDELCRRIRMNLNTRGIRILMLTAGGVEMQGLDSGADDYVSKSVSADVLMAHIRALLRRARVAPAILHSSASDFRQTRILTIDDSPTYLEHVSSELRSQGYDVESAVSGTNGLDVLRDRCFDCVLVDLEMPGMDGIEVCRRVVSTHHSLDNPVAVIIVTTSASTQDMTRGLEAGADDFVSKSNDLSVLRARIQALMRRRFFQDENRRIVEELKTKEIATVQAEAGRAAAEARAAIGEQLIRTNEELKEVNRRLKETQAQLIQTEKMASLGQLVAGIAHEINNPMAFVLNNLFTVERLMEQIAPEAESRLPEPFLRKLAKVRLRLGEMNEGLDRVKTLVLNLRTFSRLDEGELKTIDLVESIESVLMLLRHRLSGRIRVEKHFGPERELYCFAGRLNQVIMNLVSNAMDSIEGEGTVTITTLHGDHDVCISVRDTGAGIPAAIRGRIFDPFFTTKPVGKGTGLGLAISYGIIQEHHGSIEVESEEGVGSEFTIRIPRDLQSRSSL